MRLRVIALDGSKSDRLIKAAVIRLGRDPACEVAFDAGAYPKVSGEHARIERTATGCTLTHLSRSNPTLLNDRPIDGTVPVRIGDRIQLGYTGPVIEIVDIPLWSKAREHSGTDGGESPKFETVAVAPLAPSPEVPVGEPNTAITVPRALRLPARRWLIIAICASCLNVGADLVSIASSIGGLAVSNQQQVRSDFDLFGQRHVRNEKQGKVAAALMSVAATVVLMVIWLGVHWLLIWRRYFDLGLPLYKVWTGLHIGWIALGLIGLVVSLYFLAVLFSVEGEIGGGGAGIVLLCAGVLATGLNLLADVGWVVVVIATPTRQLK